MGLTTPMAISVAPPELIGVLSWWAVMLTAPLILVRRWRRRRHTEPRRAVLRHGDDHADIAPQSAAEVGGEQPRGGTLAVSGGDSPAQRARTATTVLPTASFPPRTLEPLCRYVDFRRRLELAVRDLETRLSQLPADRWRIEPYPLTGERRNTLLILGETGVFVVSATYAPGHWDDVIAVNRLATKVQLLLPGYPGEVKPAICHPFTPTRPRVWHRADDDGAWIGAWLIGGDSVLEWLEHFGVEHGLSAADLERFDELSKPNWLKPAIPAAASWPPSPETIPYGRRE